MEEALALFEALATTEPPILQCSSIIPVLDESGAFLNYGLASTAAAAEELSLENAAIYRDGVGTEARLVVARYLGGLASGVQHTALPRSSLWHRPFMLPDLNFVHDDRFGQFASLATLASTHPDGDSHSRQEVEEQMNELVMADGGGGGRLQPSPTVEGRSTYGAGSSRSSTGAPGPVSPHNRSGMLRVHTEGLAIANAAEQERIANLPENIARAAADEAERQLQTMAMDDSSTEGSTTDSSSGSSSDADADGPSGKWATASTKTAPHGKLRSRQSSKSSLSSPRSSVGSRRSSPPREPSQGQDMIERLPEGGQHRIHYDGNGRLINTQRSPATTKLVEREARYSRSSSGRRGGSSGSAESELPPGSNQDSASDSSSTDPGAAEPTEANERRRRQHRLRRARSLTLGEVYLATSDSLGTSCIPDLEPTPTKSRSKSKLTSKSRSDPSSWSSNSNSTSTSTSTTTLTATPGKQPRPPPSGPSANTPGRSHAASRRYGAHAASPKVSPRSSPRTSVDFESRVHWAVGGGPMYRGNWTAPATDSPHGASSPTASSSASDLRQRTTSPHTNPHTSMLSSPRGSKQQVFFNGGGGGGGSRAVDGEQDSKRVGGGGGGGGGSRSLRRSSVRADVYDPAHVRGVEGEVGPAMDLDHAGNYRAAGAPLPAGKCEISPTTTTTSSAYPKARVALQCIIQRCCCNV